MISKYNFYYNTDTQYYILNLRTWSLVNVTPETYAYIQSGQEELLNQEDVCLFRKKKIIIDDVCDEEQEFKKEIEKVVNRKVLYLTIMATTNCNFDCTYCYEEYISQTLTREVCDAVCDFVKRNIHTTNSIYIDWFGGEPLLAYKEIVYLSEKLKTICNKERTPLLGGMTTNGYLLKPEWFKCLLSQNILYYQVTLDGLSNSHDKYRRLKNGEGTFNRILNNLVRIKKEIKSYFKIVIRCNVTKSNIEEAKQLKSLYQKAFLGDSRFSIWFHPVMDWGGYKIKELESKLIDYKMLYENDLLSTYTTISDSMYSRICPVNSKYSFVIDPLGYIYQCSHLVQQKEKIWGNVVDDDLENLINLKDDYQISETCEKCNLFPYCIVQQCPMRRLDEYDQCKKINTMKLENEVQAYALECHKTPRE